MARTPKPWWRKDRQCWCVTIDGRRHSLGPDREAAFQRFHQLMSRPREQRTVQIDSVAGIVDAFLDWTLRNRAKRTYDWYLERTQKFLEQYPNLTVGELRPYHVLEWVDQHPHWADGHRRGCIVAVQRPLRWAEKLGYIDRSPISHIEKPQQGRRDVVISDTEFGVLLDLAGDEDFRDLLVTAWETGARPQEIWNVEARHFDEANGRWVFPAAEAKGRRRIRTVYLSERSLAISQRRAVLYPQGPLFRNTKGRPWTSFAVNCRFGRIQLRLGRSRMQELGIAASDNPDRKLRRAETDRLARQNGTRHCLYHFRHSFATRMLEAGVDALTVSTLMGHSDMTMLANVYQHLSQNPSHLRQQLQRAGS